MRSRFAVWSGPSVRLVSVDQVFVDGLKVMNRLARLSKVSGIYTLFDNLAHRSLARVLRYDR